MTWEYYYDAEDDSTIYYHGGEKVAELDGEAKYWRQNTLQPMDPHYEQIIEIVASKKSERQTQMLWDHQLGFSKLNEPYE